MNKIDCPIGVFDSGVGGISTLRVLAKMLPKEDFVFYGDSFNAPYGNRSPEEVISLSNKVVDKLLDESVKAIVIACNTATSSAKPFLVKRFPSIPILGIEPALKEAIDNGKKNILVLGTSLTLTMPKFQTQLAKFRDNYRINTLPCPGLADLIESGGGRLPEIGLLLKKLLTPINKGKIDAVVLGCTHYPFIEGMIRPYFNKTCQFYTGYYGLGTNLINNLDLNSIRRSSNQNRQIKFLSSKETKREITLYHNLFENGI